MKSESISIELLILGFIVALIIVLIIDIWQVNRLRKLLYNQEDTLSIEKYHELKWRINLFLSITAVVAILLSYFGYSFQDYTSTQISSLEEKVQKLDSVITQGEIQVDSIGLNATKLNRQLRNFNNRINVVQHEIEKIQNENVRKWEFHIVQNIKTNINSQKTLDTIYFSDLLLITGEPFPKFKSPPLVSIIRNEKVNILLIHKLTTKDYFIIEQRGDIGSDFRIENIDIWILFQ